jgi:glyoxylase-like metal-dependent hydrolase (beta-lactamase superfamily II)
MVNVTNLNGVGFSSNAFYIESEKPCLVDVGMDAVPVLQGLKGVELEFLVCTHCHIDHVGGVPELLAEHSPEVLMHELDAGFLGNMTGTGSQMFGEPAPDFKVDGLLKDGQVLNIGDIELQVIHTPGHTAGSISLFCESEGLLFSGDTVFPGGSIGRTDLPGGSSDDIKKSIARLAMLPAQTLYPGHGEVTSNDVPSQVMASLQFAETYL